MLNIPHCNHASPPTARVLDTNKVERKPDKVLVMDKQMLSVHTFR